MKRDLLFKLAVSSLVIGATTSGCTGMGKMSAVPANFAGRPEVAAKTADKARQALEAGKTAKAIALAEATVSASPRDGSYRALLGQAYLNDGRFQSAATALTEAMDVGVVDSHTVIALALAQVALGQNDEAIALIKNHSDVVPASDAGLALALAGDLNPAIYVLSNAARQPDATARTRQNLALALALSGKWVQARLIAGQDLSPAKIESRMTEWSAMAQQIDPQLRVASLIGTKAHSDSGMPVRLALSNFAEPTALAAADNSVILASADPAPVADFAPPPPKAAVQPVQEADASSAIRSVELPMPERNADGVVPVTELPSPAAADADAKPGAGQIILAKADPYRAAPRVSGEYSMEQRPFQKEARAIVAKLLLPQIASFDAKKPSGWAVQLGAYDNLAVAKEKWGTLSRKNAILANFPASSQAATVKGRNYFRLTVNGLTSQSDAVNLCRELKSAGQRCFVRHMDASENVQWASRSMVRVASR